MTASESTSLWVWSERYAGVLRDPQGFVQVRVIEHVPEPSYDLSIRQRLISNHTLHRSQHKCEKRVAAALQCRSYRGRMDELTYSRNRRAVRKVVRGRQVLGQQSL